MQFMQRSIAAQQERAKAEKEALLKELAELDRTAYSDAEVRKRMCQCVTATVSACERLMCTAVATLVQSTTQLTSCIVYAYMLVIAVQR